MKYRNLLKGAERMVGARNAAGFYYSLVFRFAPQLGLSCFNYGYADASAEIMGDEACSEPYQIELYRQTALAAGADRLKSACVLEISSGLGGGLAYIVRAFAPRIAIGLEPARPAVQSARKRFGLIAVEGDALDLRLPANAFDVVLNVEASHVYFGDEFLAGVARVLRPGGIFAIADSRQVSPPEAEAILRQAFERHGLSITSFRDITANVARSCERDDPRREAILGRLPFFVRSPLRQMLGGVSTPTYANFRDRRTTYFIATAVKSGG